MVPDGLASHKAVMSGDWENPEVWLNKNKPQYGAIVHIPEGIRVRYSGEESPHIFAIRNDGVLEIVNKKHKHSKLILDTLINTSSGELLIHSQGGSIGIVEVIIAPFSINQWKRNQECYWSAKAKDYFVDGGEIYTLGGGAIQDGVGALGRFFINDQGETAGWDPDQISLGIVSSGKLVIRGEEKTPFVRLGEGGSVGSKTIMLEEKPVGWRLNDQVIVTGSRFELGRTDTPYTTQDEVKSIVGNMLREVYLDSGLILDHQGDQLVSQSAHVANISRSVVVRSLVKGPISHRGHVILKGSGASLSRVEFGAFLDLGRTDKTKLVDDYPFSLKIKDNGNPVIEVLSTNKDIPSRIENMPGRYPLHFHRVKGDDEKTPIAVGNVVIGSPGWGMVHHDSNVIMNHNIVASCTGAGMVAESGSEIGEWKENLVTSITGHWNPQVKNSEEQLDISKAIHKQARAKIDDDFRLGDAYAFQGRLLDVEGNVASSSVTGYRFDGNTDFEPHVDEVPTKKLKNNGFPLQASINPDTPPLTRFIDNSVYGSYNAFTSRARFERSFNHLMSIVDGFYAWNMTNRGIYMASNYSYIFKNTHIKGLMNEGSIGVLLDNNNDDIHFVDSSITGMSSAVSGGGINSKGENRNNAEANFIFFNTYFDLANPFLDMFPQPRVVESDGLTHNRFYFTGNENLDLNMDVVTGDYLVVVDGLVTDSVGEYEFGHLGKNGGPNDRRIYNFEGKLDWYLSQYGCESANDVEVVTPLVEYVSDRVSGEQHAIEFEIKIKGRSCRLNH